MNFYLKNPSEQIIQGPFAATEIKAELEKGAINHEWLATADLGETMKELKKSPNRDWTLLREMPSIAGNIPETKAPLKKTDPDNKIYSVLPSVLLGIALGWVTGFVSSGMMEWAILFMLVGAVINSILVCLLVNKLWIFVSMVPVMASIVALMNAVYQDAHRSDGMDFAMFFQKYQGSLILMLWYFAPALITAGIFHACKR